MFNYIGFFYYICVVILVKSIPTLIMKSKDFIIKRLNELRNIFPELSFKYKFNPNTSTHVIDVQPLDCYKENADYIKYEADFGFEFDNIFYPETVLFVSEDSLTQINNPEFVF